MTEEIVQDAHGKLLSRFDFIAPLLESKYQVIESLPQYVTEEILRQAFLQRGGKIQYESKVVHVEETIECVTVHLEEKESIQARWIVGCEGGHSVVRKEMGVEFEGRVGTCVKARDRSLILLFSGH